MIKKSLLFFGLVFCNLLGYTQPQKLIVSEFIDTIPVTPSCHASSIIEVPGGMMAAWFGGEHESHPQVGIYVSILKNGKWSKAV